MVRLGFLHPALNKVGFSRPAYKSLDKKWATVPRAGTEATHRCQVRIRKTSLTLLRQAPPGRVALFYLSLVSHSHNKETMQCHALIHGKSLHVAVHGLNDSKMPWRRGERTQHSSAPIERTVTTITDRIKNTLSSLSFPQISLILHTKNDAFKYDKMQLSPNCLTALTLTIQEEESPSLIRERLQHRGLPIYSDPSSNIGPCFEWCN